MRPHRSLQQPPGLALAPINPPRAAAAAAAAAAANAAANPAAAAARVAPKPPKCKRGQTERLRAQRVPKRVRPVVSGFRRLANFVVREGHDFHDTVGESCAVRVSQCRVMQ
jgi:hypothetical protein